MTASHSLATSWKYDPHTHTPERNNFRWHADFRENNVWSLQMQDFQHKRITQEIAVNADQAVLSLLAEEFRTDFYRSYCTNNNLDAENASLFITGDMVDYGRSLSMTRLPERGMTHIVDYFNNLDAEEQAYLTFDFARYVMEG